MFDPDGLTCQQNRSRFSAYLDGALTGVEMHQLGEHLEDCRECEAEFSALRAIQSSVASLGPARPPADLALRLRVAISRERERTPQRMLTRLSVQWENTVAPLLLRASAGFASAVLLIGTVGLLIGTFATPEPLTARDEPIGMATNPRLLYSGVPDGATEADPPDSSIQGSVVVRAFVDRQGRVYDFHVISGAMDQQTHAALENKLLFSTFEPARVFGQPVPGSVLLSFADVSVQG
jgi:hypothetical protein